MSLPKTFLALAMFTAVLSGPTASRGQEGYMVAMRPDTGRGWVFISNDENLEIHKGFDATLRYVSDCDGFGAPTEYKEEGIGFSLDVTDFTRDGNTFRFNMVVERRQIIGWESVGQLLRPVFQTRTFRTTAETGPRTVQYGEWFDLIPGDDATSALPKTCFGDYALFSPE